MYLGAAASQLEQQYDESWRKRVGPDWKKQHEEMSAALRRVTEIDARPAESLTEQEELERLAACVSLGDLGRAGTLAAALLVRAPDLPEALYYVGRKLLLEGDARGAEHIERAMRARPAAIESGCQVLCEFFWQRGDMDQVDRFREWATTRQREELQARQERATITNDSHVGPHGWAEDLVTRLRDTLATIPEVREAYLCRLIVKYLPEQPCYVLGVLPPYRWVESKQHSAELRNAVAKRIDAPHQVMVFVLTTHLRPLSRVMEHVPGARVK